MDAPLLIIEDSVEDYEVAVRAIRRAGVERPIIHAADGRAALRYLRREEPHADAPRPALVLLDLNLPGIHGRVVLAELKGDPLLRAIPVIVLTTSRQPRDIEQCYALGANAYLHKPVDLPRFYAAIAALCSFWLTYVVLPDGAG